MSSSSFSETALGLPRSKFPMRMVRLLKRPPALLNRPAMHVSNKRRRPEKSTYPPPCHAQQSDGSARDCLAQGMAPQSHTGRDHPSRCNRATTVSMIVEGRAEQLT